MTKSKIAPPFDNPDYARGFYEGQNHSAPSAETTRRLNELSEAIKVIPQMYTEIQVLNANLKNYLDSVTEIRQDVAYLQDEVGKLHVRISVMAVKLAIGGIIAIAVVEGFVAVTFNAIFK